jgi:hypothetical protein
MSTDAAAAAAAAAMVCSADMQRQLLSVLCCCYCCCCCLVLFPELQVPLYMVSRTPIPVPKWTRLTQRYPAKNVLIGIFCLAQLLLLVVWSAHLVLQVPL